MDSFALSSIYGKVTHFPKQKICLSFFRIGREVAWWPESEAYETYARCRIIPSHIQREKFESMMTQINAWMNKELIVSDGQFSELKVFYTGHTHYTNRKEIKGEGKTILLQDEMDFPHIFIIPVDSWNTLQKFLNNFFVLQTIIKTEKSQQNQPEEEPESAMKSIVKFSDFTRGQVTIPCECQKGGELENKSVCIGNTYDWKLRSCTASTFRDFIHKVQNKQLKSFLFQMD